MSGNSPERGSTHRRQRGFSFLEVLLVLGIIGMLTLCVFGFFLSRSAEPLKIPAAAPRPAAATPVPAAPAP